MGVWNWCARIERPRGVCTERQARMPCSRALLIGTQAINKVFSFSVQVTYTLRFGYPHRRTQPRRELLLLIWKMSRHAVIMSWQLTASLSLSITRSVHGECTGNQGTHRLIHMLCVDEGMAVAQVIIPATGAQYLGNSPPHGVWVAPLPNQATRDLPLLLPCQPWRFNVLQRPKLLPGCRSCS
jgi:hypothetical protein